MKAVFESVEQRPEVQQQRRNNPYHLLQKYIILDDVESLLREAHVWLNDGLAPHLLRCLTHVVLFLRKIGRISQQQETLCTDIMEACVKVGVRCVGSSGEVLTSLFVSRTTYTYVVYHIVLFFSFERIRVLFFFF